MKVYKVQSHVYGEFEHAKERVLELRSLGTNTNIKVLEKKYIEEIGEFDYVVVKTLEVE